MILKAAYIAGKEDSHNSGGEDRCSNDILCAYSRDIHLLNISFPMVLIVLSTRERASSCYGFHPHEAAVLVDQTDGQQVHK